MMINTDDYSTNLVNIETSPQLISEDPISSLGRESISSTTSSTTSLDHRKITLPSANLISFINIYKNSPFIKAPCEDANPQIHGFEEKLQKWIKEGNVIKTLPYIWAETDTIYKTRWLHDQIRTLSHPILFAELSEAYLEAAIENEDQDARLAYAIQAAAQFYVCCILTAADMSCFLDEEKTVTTPEILRPYFDNFEKVPEPIFSQVSDDDQLRITLELFSLAKQHLHHYLDHIDNHPSPAWLLGVKKTLSPQEDWIKIKELVIIEALECIDAPSLEEMDAQNA